MSAPLFDTNIVIDWLLRRTPAYDELRRYPAIRISRITWAETIAGEPLATRETVKHLIRRFEIVEVDAAIAELAADISQRTRIKLLDTLIYASAQISGAILVTRNTKDFPPDTPGVHVPYTL